MNRALLQANIRARGEGNLGPKLTVVVDPASAPPVQEPRQGVASGTHEPTPTEIPPVPEPAPGDEFSRGRLHARTMQTVFGEISVSRRVYIRPGHDGVHPLDEQLGLPGRCYSYEVQRMLVKEAIRGPFDEATSSVRELTGLPLPTKSAEDIAVEAAEDFDALL